ncbi:MAG TPA: DUF6101 family protein [Beijerinckiaceae bacterium]|nr:DUF6101 family protein [Beijerinckiaceae bacterium]
MPNCSSSIARNRADAQEFSLVTSDPRAEDAKRMVRFGRSCVTISRRLAGMRMRIRVPTSLYRGVVLEKNGGEAAPLYRLRLDHPDADLCVPLFEAGDSVEIIAEWTAWADFFDLPRLLGTAAGSCAAFDAKIGSVALGAARPDRKRGRAVVTRRARFLTRRKMGVSPSAPG